MTSKLTEAARDQECTLQIHPYCNGNPETTAGAHITCEDKGCALKSPDWWLVDACSSCHDIIDGRTQVDLPEIEILKCLMRGLYRTLRRRIREQDLIKVPRGCE
jgi:hypothetical protein